MTNPVMNGSIVCDVIEIQRARRKVESCCEEGCAAAVKEGVCVWILVGCGY